MTGVIFKPCNRDEFAMYLGIALLGITVVALYRILTSVVEKLIANRKRRDVLREIPCEHYHWLHGNGRYFSADEQGLTNEVETVKKHPRCHQIWYGRLCYMSQGTIPIVQRPC